MLGMLIKDACVAVCFVNIAVFLTDFGNTLRIILPTAPKPVFAVIRNNLFISRVSMRFFSIVRLPAFLAAFCILFSVSLSAQSKDWKPATPQELEMTTPRVEPDADAEAILWDVYVTDEDSGGDLQTVLHHYLKIKIFNDRGRESFSKVDLPFGRIAGIGFDVKIKDIAARTTKRDGTEVELKGSDVFEQDRLVVFINFSHTSILMEKFATVKIDECFD